MRYRTGGSIVSQFDIHPAHPFWTALFVITLCGWVSGWLIFRLWRKHPQDPARKRILWSIILCIPFFGWLAYGGFYTPLPENSIKARGRRY